MMEIMKWMSEFKNNILYYSLFDIISSSKRSDNSDANLGTYFIRF